MSTHFGEVLTAIVTPFDKRGDVNYQELRKLASHLIDNGSDGLVVLGTTGEVPSLTKREKKKVLENIVDEVGDRANIVAGTGSYSTTASIELTQIAENIGVDGIMAVVPYYNKPPQEGLYQHFSQIARNTSLPLMIYNVPGRTSRNINVDTVCRLAEIENIIAIKEASGNLNQVSNLCRLLDQDFYVYSGDDNLTLPVLSVGGQGVVSVASHIVGNQIKEMIREFKKGNLEKAIEINKKLGPVYNGMFITTNPIPVKAALNMTGSNVGNPRLPLIGIDESERKKLKEILEGIDLI